MQVPKSLALAAMVVGIAGGSYGLASAASGTSTSTTAAATPAAPSPLQQPSSQQPSPQQPWGGRRSDETPLTGDALARVTAIAKAKVSGGTIVRVETDADGHAAYEAHMTDASGNPVTVYVDSSFNAVSVEQRP